MPKCTGCNISIHTHIQTNTPPPPVGNSGRTHPSKFQHSKLMLGCCAQFRLAKCWTCNVPACSQAEYGPAQGIRGDSEGSPTPARSGTGWQDLRSSQISMLGVSALHAHVHNNPPRVGSPGHIGASRCCQPEGRSTSATGKQWPFQNRANPPFPLLLSRV